MQYDGKLIEPNIDRQLVYSSLYNFIINTLAGARLIINSTYIVFGHNLYALVRKTDNYNICINNFFFLCVCVRVCVLIFNSLRQ